MAESPDEEALVKAGRDLGWVFSRREHNSVEVSVPGKVARSKMSDNVMRFKILATIPFDSTRKRMSVIVQFVGCDDAFVLSKGADNIMLDRASNFITGERISGVK
jgi:magnesium-transporting ATPase (P-type)